MTRDAILRSYQGGSNRRAAYRTIVGSIALFALLSLGCRGLTEHTLARIEHDGSPAAPYVAELWDLASSSPWDRPTHDRWSPDGTFRLLVDYESIELMRGQDRVLQVRRCFATRLFDLDSEVPLVASWSGDAKAILIQTTDSRHSDALYDLGEGCGRGPPHLVFLIDPGGFWQVPPFQGTRSEALQAAASASDFVALPALDALSVRYLDPSEVEGLIPAWAQADQDRKRFLTRPMLGGYLCHSPDSVTELLLTNEALPPDLREALLAQILQRFSDGRGSQCLRIPRLVEALARTAEADASFAGHLVESIEGFSGYQAAKIRRRFADRPSSPVPTRPAPDRLLTTDAHRFTYLTVGEAEARWIQRAVAQLSFPIATRDLRHRIGLLMELLEPRTTNPPGIYPWTIRRLRDGFELHTFYATADQVELAEVLVREPVASRDDKRHPAPEFPSREAALASLLDGGAAAGSLAAGVERCDGVFEGRIAGRLECYRPDPYQSILLQVLERGVRAAARPTRGRSISSVDVGYQRYVLVIEGFPRVGLSLYAETEGVHWPLLLDGDLAFDAGELRLVEGEIEVCFRGQRLAWLTPDTLTLRRTDGSVDCARVGDRNSRILLRELRRDDTDLCTRLAAASVGRIDAEVIEDAARSADWRVRGPGLVASLRNGNLPLPAATEALRGLSSARRRLILQRLCAETMAHRGGRDRGIDWIRKLADAVDLEVPHGCF